MTRPEALPRAYEAALARLREQMPLPALPGRSDIYSFHQAYLLASSALWSPRPVFQSYFAYTPMLAEMNRRHLLGRDAPDNIFFRVEPIDGRLPSLEDGPSWPELASRYAPVGLTEHFLLLRRLPEAPAPRRTPLVEREAGLGEWLPVPASASGERVMAALRLTPTFAGRLANLLYKPEQLRIEFRLEDGSTRGYRLVPAMAEAGFLLSPLVEGEAEFALLHARTELLANKAVQAFRVVGAGEGAGPSSWRSRFRLTLDRLETPPPLDLSAWVPTTPPEAAVATAIGTTDACIGDLQRINNAPLARFEGRVRARRTLSLEGWMVADLRLGLPVEGVSVVLSDPAGVPRHVFPARMFNLPDIARLYRMEGLTRSGFRLRADLSGLSGHYVVSLARERGDHLELCPQWKMPVLIQP